MDSKQNGFFIVLMVDSDDKDSTPFWCVFLTLEIKKYGIQVLTPTGIITIVNLDRSQVEQIMAGGTVTKSDYGYTKMYRKLDG